MQRAQGSREERMFAQMARAEQRYEQEQEQAGGGKRARLLHKLEEGGSGGKGAAGGLGGGGSSSSGLTDALRQTARRQLAGALSGNAALATGMGGSRRAAALADALEQQLAAGASKSVFQSKLTSLVLQIRKAQAATDVPALAPHLAAAAGGAAPAAAESAAAAPAAAEGTPSVTAVQLQAQVAEAVRLAGAAASPGSSSSDAASQPAAAAAAALHGLAAMPVTVQLLEQTGAGKAIQKLRKHPLVPVAAAAGACVSAWKARVLAA